MFLTIAFAALIIPNFDAPKETQNLFEVGSVVMINLDGELAEEFNEKSTKTKGTNFEFHMVGIVTKNFGNGQITIQYEFNPAKNPPYLVTFTTDADDSSIARTCHPQPDGTQVIELNNLTKATIKRWVLAND